MITTIEKYAQRPKRSYQADGLMDIASGLSILGIGFEIYVGILTSASMAAGMAAGEYPPHAMMRVGIINMLANCVTFAIIPLSFRGIEPLKRRFVYPRSGYMAPRIIPQDQRMRMAYLYIMGSVIVTAIFAYFGANVGRLPTFWTPDMTLLSSGIFLGVILAVNFLKFGFIRHLAVAVISVLVSILLVSQHMGWQQGFVWLTVIIGVSLIVAGAVPFLRLLQTPPATENEIG